MRLCSRLALRVSLALPLCNLYKSYTQNITIIIPNPQFKIKQLCPRMQVQQTWVMPREPVWLHKNQQFVKAVIKQIFKDIITCTLESGDSVKCKRADIYHRNPVPIDSSRTDLMDNDIINEPEILQHLSMRFLDRKIYTYVENTLIAVNPYFMIPELYTDEVKDKYIRNIIQSKDTGINNFKEEDPHLYAMTAQMVKALFLENCSQAVIISGESGAGKTEVNKQCLRFLAHYFKSLHKDENKNMSIERAIMLSNPILEAFGNAKTIRNNNSSRFGKYLSIMIDGKTREIKHAQIYNYLLEKSRIISRSQQEQNFHIFYQLLTKTTPGEKQKYHLTNTETHKELTFQDFNYTCNKLQTEYLAHPDISLEKIKESLTILPDPRSFDYLCRILAAVLHLGNLEPYEDENLDYCEIMGEVDTVCGLLEIEKKYLMESLTSYSIKIGGEDLVKSFSKRQVQQLIHSLSKTLYQRLFQWIINEINSSTRSRDQQTSKLIALGFLDIYGFEVLKTNSLEQLFINYTNQRLHQLYLHKIFKLEKEYFAAEKLEQKFKQVNFEDNVKVLELIDYEKLSIFNLLDQQCAIASPDESTFITKIRFNHKKHEKFPSSNLNLVSTQFIIKHTPQDVQYSVMGFREKNRDLLREQIKITMRSSKLKILQTMFSEPKTENQMDAKAHKVRKFLSAKFRKEMNELVDGLLSRSEQLFIRCIKSNGNKKPMEIEQEIVYSQIKYLGILDTIQIKKMGYCIKIKYEDMDKRFYWIIRRNFMMPASPKEVTQAVKTFLPKFGDDDILYGTTKIFFKDYAFTLFLRKFGLQMVVLNAFAHRLTNLFVKNNYLRKKQRKNGHKKTIKRYIRSFLEAKKLRQKLKNVSKVQKAILSFLSFRSRAKKLESVQILQAYIKRNLESRMRVKRINLIEKVIFKFKFLLLRKKVRSGLIANSAIQHVLSNFWGVLRKKNSQILAKYLNGYKTRVQKKQFISLAIRNERNAIEGRSLQHIEKYLVSFSKVTGLRKREIKIKSLQSNVRTFLERRRYEKVLGQIRLIQRAVRQYLFLKKGAKTMFEKTYSSYEKTMKIQNKAIQNRLYDSEEAHAHDMNASIRKFLGKFKQKISLLYFVIDFESFIDLEIIYPKQSWVLNLAEVFEEGLQKNDPVQYLSVGETFTVVANTTKMYLWGIHESYKNVQPDAICIVKTKMPVQFYEVNKNKLNYSYIKDEQAQKRNSELKNFKICSTVARDFNLQNGKIYECLPNELRLIRDIPSSQRVLEISCGKAHTIFRTSAKKVYTFGVGREGQLGHSTFNSQDRPKVVKFFQTIKTATVIQVSASFTSSLVLLSNRKMYWFGKNGTLNQVSTPKLFELKSKLQALNSNQFSIARVLTTWSRTLSIIGVTILCYNGKFENNVSLRNRTTEILFTKWQQAGIHNINPPVIPAISDHLEQCHVKLRSKKINIYPESKMILKDMQEKVKSIGSLAGGLESTTNRNSIGTEFSFANTQKNSFYK